MLLRAVDVAADRRKQIEGAIAALGSLRSAVASEQSRILDEVVALLASLDGELASLSAKLRWHASAPFRSKKDEALEGQLAFELLRMLTGHLGQEPAADGVQPSEGDAPPSDGDKPSDQNAPGGRGSRPHRERRGRGLRRKIEEVKVEDSEVPKCPCCTKQLAEMGFDVRERFIYRPAEIYILEERIYKYGCRCAEVVVTAEPTEPPKPIPGGMASSSMLAQLAIGKVLDGNPVERFAKQLRRQDIDLATSTLHDWFGRVGVARSMSWRRSCLAKRWCAPAMQITPPTFRLGVSGSTSATSIRSPMPRSHPTGRGRTPSGSSKALAATSRTTATPASTRCSSAPTRPGASDATTTDGAGSRRPSSRATAARSR